MKRSLLICRICGDVARGMNFNVMSCISCKAFFRRNALKPAGILQCRNKSNCKITKEERGKCGACRLKKCFSFGMKPQLIRSFVQNQLSTPQPLSLLRNDRSTLTSEQWNLISNIIHACEERNYANRIKSLFNDASKLPVKLRGKPTFALNCVYECLSLVEPLMNQSPDFHSLSVDARRSVVMRNTLFIAALCNSHVVRDADVLSNKDFALSFNGAYGFDFLKQLCVIFYERLDVNRTLIKIMTFVLAFSTNCSIVTYDSSQDFGTESMSNDLIHVQDIYITLLWKYLIYLYGFEEAVRRKLSHSADLDKTMKITNIQTEQTKRSLLICRICGDVARGMNFDVITCISCKAFFRRNALRLAGTLQCRKKSNCKITQEERSKCGACRLKKCFSFGMKPQLIRSFVQNQLPTPQPLSLLQNDRSTLSFEQWNLISNIIHVCDERSLASHLKSLLDEALTLPIKVRVKPSFALNYSQEMVRSAESLINQSSHFHSLSTHARGTVVMRNTILTASLFNSLGIRDLDIFNNEHFALSLSGTHGFDFLKKLCVIFYERLDFNRTITKIMTFVLAFSSNCSIVTFHSSQDIGTESTSIDLIHVQDIYITVLWKYLTYQYGFEEAVQRYSSLILTILDMFNSMKKVLENQMYEQMVDRTLKEMKNSLIIED